MNLHTPCPHLQITAALPPPPNRCPAVYQIHGAERRFILHGTNDSYPTNKYIS